VDQQFPPLTSISMDGRSALAFAYGLGNGLYFPLVSEAGPVHYPGSVTAESAFHVIGEQRPPIFSGVPAFYAIEAVGK
jgi:acyl-coenzyme A synthetase/AMP-(fatty) acid ligase